MTDPRQPPAANPNEGGDRDPADRDAARPDEKRGGSSRRRRVLISLGVAAFVGLVGWFLVIPYPIGLGEGPVETTAVMEQRLAEDRELEIRHEWVPLTEISSRVERAVVVAEDYRFRLHEGIDWVSLAEEVEWSGGDDFSWFSPSDLAALLGAVRYVWSHRDELRGRSTITQQLAKNLYFGTDRSLVRKAMEAIVAKRLERHLDKDRILELYLNVAEWGPGIFGVEAAARSYFGVPASSLSLEQAAALAATLPHPLTSNPRTRPGRMAWRKELILDRIDPARGIPAAPTPIPRPTFDIGIPAPSVPDVGSLATTPPVDTQGSDDTTVVADSASGMDTSAVLDTIGASDTAVVRDTATAPDTVPTGDSAATPDEAAVPGAAPIDTVGVPDRVDMPTWTSGGDANVPVDDPEVERVAPERSSSPPSTVFPLT